MKWREETYIYASDAYIYEPWIGMVSLTESGWNREYLDAGLAPMLLHHSPKLPVGEVQECWFTPGVGEQPGLYRGKVRIPEGIDVRYIDEYLRLLDATKLLDPVSVGYSIDRLNLVEFGDTWMEDKFDAAWTQYEFSALAIPADMLATIEREERARDISAAKAGDRLRLTRGGRGLGWVDAAVVADARREADLARRLKTIRERGRADDR